MKQKFTANILFLIGINILIKPFYALAIDTSVQNIVGPESYGLFLAIFNFIYIQQVFADLGVQNFNNRDISRNPEKLSRALPKILGAKIIFTLSFIGLTLLTSWIFGYLKYFSSILIWVIGSQASLSMLLYLRTNISGSGRYFTDSFFSVLDKLILIIWLSYILWINPGMVDLDITYFVKVQFISLLTTVILVLIYTGKELVSLSFSIDLTFIKNLLVKSLPYATLVILMAGYSRLDGIMLEKLLDDNALAAGEYARSFRLYDTFNNFTFLFAVLLLPMLSGMIKRKENLDGIVKWAFRLLSLISLFSIIMVYFVGNDILNLLYTDESETFPTTLFLLMLAGLGLSLNYIYGTLLTANGNIKTLNVIAIIGFFLNISLNLAVISRYGKEGAALATAVTQGVVLLLQIFYSYRYFDLENLLKPILKLLVGSIIAIGLFYALETLTSTHFLIKIILVGILYLFSAFQLRLIRASDFKMI